MPSSRSTLYFVLAAVLALAAACATPGLVMPDSLDDGQAVVLDSWPFSTDDARLAQAR